MSATIDVPRGLDKLDATEQALLDSMRDDGPDPVETPADLAPAAEDAGDFEIEIDAPPEAPEPRTKTVPHAQFHAANEKRKVAEAKATAAEAKAAQIEAQQAKDRAVLQARIDTITALAAMPAAPTPAPVAAAAAEPELPDVATDPVGHFKALYDRTQTSVDSLKGIIAGMQEGQQAVRQASEMRAWGEQQERAFMAKEPSYVAAMEHLRQSRHDELSAIGVGDPQERERIIASDVNAIFQRARQEGASPAERLFNASVQRGYAKAVPPPVIPPLEAPVAAPVAAPVVDNRAARLEEARENATTIGSLGAAPPAKLSVAKIAEMDDSAFEALVNKMRASGGTALRDLMGH